MQKALTLAVGLALAAFPMSAGAQAIDPFPADILPACPLVAPAIAVGITPLKCVGFYVGNSIDYAAGTQIESTGNTSNTFSALSLMGYDTGNTYSVVEKKESWNGTADFMTQLVGLTVIGFYWGNFPPPDDDGPILVDPDDRDPFPDPPPVFVTFSAFYQFDFGPAGTKDFDLAIVESISSAAVISTGTVVPEPSSYVLMAAGLAALMLVGRSRRSSSSRSTVNARS